jgi:predicted secreted protein
MAKQAGSGCLIQKNSVTIGGARTVSITVNGSPIDVQDQGDGNVVTYLSGVLTGQSLELSIDGYEEDNVLRDISLGPVADKFMTDLSFVFPGGDDVTGNFTMTNYSETGAYEDGQTFTATFGSDGAWTHTPA